MDMSTNVSLSIEEIRQSIAFWLKETKQMEVDPNEIDFQVEGFDRPDDWRAQYDLEYKLTGASFTLRGAAR